MTPVSNSSVLIGLSSIGHLELIHDRFPSGIIIPPAVHHEVVITGSNRPGAQAVANAGWITQHPLAHQNLVNLLQTTLDHGESEAIALAVEQQKSRPPDVSAIRRIEDDRSRTLRIFSRTDDVNQAVLFARGQFQS